MKHHKLGFSLIEILVFFSIIITFSIGAFLIYKTVNNNSKIKMISDDFKYVASKISHDMSGLKQDNLSVKSGCCETFSFIDSGLPFVSGTPAFEPNYIHAEAEKKYKNPLGGDHIQISLHYGSDSLAKLKYTIGGPINAENCIKLISNNVKIAESVYILNRSGSTLSDQGGKTLSGSYTNKATPKSISSACNNGDIKYITLSYTV